MKLINKILLSLLLCVLLVSVFAACTDENTSEGPQDPTHEHNYIDTVTPPNCVDQGYTTHTCSCGDTYVDTYVPAGGHYYTCAVTTFPSADENGVRTYTCTGCQHTYTENIDALILSLPQANNLLALLLGEGTRSISVSKDADIILLHEVSDNTIDTSTKQFIALQAADAMISVEGKTPTGFIKVEYGTATVTIKTGTDPDTVNAPAAFDAYGAFNIFLNGEDLSVELISGDDTTKHDYKLSKLFYTAVAQAMGVSYDDVIETLYFCEQIEDYTPAITAMLTSLSEVLTPDIDIDFEALAVLLGNKMITSTPNPDETITYSLNIAALSEFITVVDDLTAAEVIDYLYGTNASTVLITYITSIPDKTVQEVATELMALSATYGFDLNKTYELINLAIYCASEVSFDIENEMETRYDKTIADVVAELACMTNPDSNPAAIASLFKTAILSLATTIPTYTIDEFYNLIYYGNPGYIPEDANVPYSICATLQNMIAALKTATTVDITVNTDGNVCAANIVLNDEKLFDTVININYTNTNNIFSLSCVIDAYKLLATESENSSIGIEFYMDELLILDGDYFVTADGFEVEATLNYNKETFHLILGKTATDFYLELETSTYALFELEVSKTEDYTEVYLDFNIVKIDETTNPETKDVLESTETLVDLLNLRYTTDNKNNIELVLTTMGYTVLADIEKDDTEFVFDVEVLDANETTLFMLGIEAINSQDVRGLGVLVSIQSMPIRFIAVEQANGGYVSLTINDVSYLQIQSTYDTEGNVTALTADVNALIETPNEETDETTFAMVDVLDMTYTFTDGIHAISATLMGNIPLTAAFAEENNVISGTLTVGHKDEMGYTTGTFTLTKTVQSMFDPETETTVEVITGIDAALQLVLEGVTYDITVKADENTFSLLAKDQDNVYSDISVQIDSETGDRNIACIFNILEYKEETETYELVNALTYRETVTDGVYSTKLLSNDLIYDLSVESKENGVRYTIECNNGMDISKGYVEITTISTENSESTVIDIDLKQLLNSKTIESDNEYTVEIYDIFNYLICDAVITMTQTK